MGNRKTTGLIHTDLAFDLEKLKGYDKPKVRKDGYTNEEVVYTIEVNDQTYQYFQKKDRDADCKLLKRHLAGVPVLQIKTKEFVTFMTDDDGTDMRTIAKSLIKKGSFTIEELLEDCSYIPSRAIANIKKIPKELRNGENDGDFEVYPDDFIVLFV